MTNLENKKTQTSSPSKQGAPPVKGALKHNFLSFF